MLITSRAIFLQKIKYNEKTTLVKLFTENNGLLCFSVKGNLQKGKNQKAGFFQPLSLLEISYRHKEKNDVHTLHEIRYAHAFTFQAADMQRTGILFFLNDVLNKILKQPEPDKSLFEFIFSSLQYLDMHDGRLADFHLLFLLKLTDYLGISPMHIASQRDAYQLPPKLRTFYEYGYNHLDALYFIAAERREALHAILNYYRFHLVHFPELQSVKILEEVLA